MIRLILENEPFLMEKLTCAAIGGSLVGEGTLSFQDVLEVSDSVIDGFHPYVFVLKRTSMTEKERGILEFVQQLQRCNVTGDGFELSPWKNILPLIGCHDIVCHMQHEQVVYDRVLAAWRVPWGGEEA